MAKIPVIFEAGRADGKLIKTNSIYDDNQEKFLSDKIEEIDNSNNNLNNTVSILTNTVNNNKLDIETKLDEEKTRAANAENNLRETISNITEVSGSATTANIVTINTLSSSTASNVQQALDILYKNYTYAGIATPTTNPGTPDGPVFYITTTTGSYSNFGNIEISKGESAILKWNNGTWEKSSFKPMTDFNSVFDAEGRSLADKIDIDIQRGSVFLSNEFYTQGYVDINGNFAKNPIGYTFYRTDYIEVTEGIKIKCALQKVKSNLSIIAAYDENKNFLIDESILGKIGAEPIVEKVIPSSVKYVVITIGTIGRDVVEFFNVPAGFITRLNEIYNTNVYTKINNVEKSFKDILMGDSHELYKLNNYENLTTPVGSGFWRYKNLSEKGTRLVTAIHFIPTNESVRIYKVDLENNTELLYTFDKLTKGIMYDKKVSITLEFNEVIAFDERTIYYQIDNNAETIFTNYGRDYKGYLSYWIEEMPLKIPSTEEIKENIKLASQTNNFSTENSFFAGNLVLISAWNMGENIKSELISGSYTYDTEKGILVSNSDYMTIYNGFLSKQTNILHLSVDKGSEFTILLSLTEGVGFCISFKENKIYNTLNPNEYTEINQDFLTGNIDNMITIKLVEDNGHFVIDVLNEQQSSRVAFDIDNGYHCFKRRLRLMANSGRIYLHSYQLYYPTGLDVIFSGDSITEGVSTEKSYAMLFKEYTGLNVATYALAGGQLSIGLECAKKCSTLKPKCISIMFGMNKGNNLDYFKEIQTICDRYYIPLIVQHMPMAKDPDRYNTQTAIIEDFINNYAHIKMSARFDIATAIDGKIENGYNSELTDGTHPNQQGHAKMFNRLIIDTPIIFNNSK